MKNYIPIYIDEKKFQFITELRSYQFQMNNVGENSITYNVDFSNISISERIIFSAYLTLLCQHNECANENLYNIIFNFNNNKYGKLKLYDQFIRTISKMLKEKLYYFAFIKHNFDKIKNNRTEICRTQLSSNDMEKLYHTKNAKSMNSIFMYLYIIGISKLNIKTKLSSFALSEFCQNNITLAQKYFDTTMNYIDENVVNIEYFVDRKKLCHFEVKKEQQVENEKTKEIKNYKEEIKQIKKEPVVIEKKVEQKQEKNDPLNLGDLRLTQNDILKFMEDNFYKIQNFEVNVKICREFYDSKIFKETLLELEKKGDESKIIHGESLNEPDDQKWKIRKENAENNIKIIKNKIISYLNKLYDEDQIKFKNILYYICKNENWKKLFTNF